MPLKAGSKQDGSSFANSMADAMRKAFLEEWPYVMEGADLPVDTKQMEMLFAAVAKGVVRHLVAKANSFKVKVTISGTTYTGEVSHIDAS